MVTRHGFASGIARWYLSEPRSTRALIVAKMALSKLTRLSAFPWRISTFATVHFLLTSYSALWIMILGLRFYNLRIPFILANLQSPTHIIIEVFESGK